MRESLKSFSLVLMLATSNAFSLLNVHEPQVQLNMGETSTFCHSNSCKSDGKTHHWDCGSSRCGGCFSCLPNSYEKSKNYNSSAKVSIQQLQIHSTVKAKSTTCQSNICKNDGETYQWECGTLRCGGCFGCLPNSYQRL